MATHYRSHHSRPFGGQYGPARGTTRPTGREFRALVWLLRHPALTAAPLLVAWAVITYGLLVTAAATVGLVALVLGWRRAHPPSFDRWAAPHIRAGWRRWTTYRGNRWAAMLADCDLIRDNRRTGEPLIPRVLRVRSATPSVDTVYVRPARGQNLRTWTDNTEALADALGAHRVAITRTRPGVLALVIERRQPFTEVIPAPDIPTDAADIDLSALDVGDTEHTTPLLVSVAGGAHRLVAGATGRGKGSLIFAPLRALGPAIPAGLVRVWMIDLKGGAETERAHPLFHRRAITMPDALALLTAVREEMRRRQDLMRETKTRRCAASTDTPVELVMIDELAMLTAYGDRTAVREALRLLAEILTQGRAAGICVWGYIQEPSKDVLDVRELFTTRMCLGVTAASHVDMVLGEGARERGALADEIPADEAHAGIGYLIEPRNRLPIRFRAAYVTDHEIDELVDRCGRHHPASGDGGEVIDLHPRNNPDTDRQGDGDEDGAA